MPLYRLIFLTECNCMSEEALNIVEDNGHYYLTEEGLYLSMFGGTRAPSLLPRYATDYVVHKEVVRKIYIEKIENFLFDQKKVVYPPLPFYIGSYKFSKVKSTLDFVKELEYFHFGEMSFHRNDFDDKVSNYCAAAGVHFEYMNYWDKNEEIFHNARNMTTLRKRFKKKITTIGGKGEAVEQQKKQEEEVVKKRGEEALKLWQELEKWLAGEEDKKNKEEEEAQKK